MENRMLKQALEYAHTGKSVIPLMPNKKCFIEWKKYQSNRADDNQINDWWNKYPTANCGIVTGEISGIDSIDIDSQEAYDRINDYFIPTNFISPVYKTPDNGYQIWVKHRPGLVNRANLLKDVINGVDVRTNGGYTVAPVSKCDYTKHGRHIIGSHKWLDALSFKNVEISEWPDMLFETLLQKCSLINTDIKKEKVTDNLDGIWIKRFSDKICEGERDETLFHIGNCLVKGGMPHKEAEKLLLLLNHYTFNKPMDEKEVIDKIKSAIQRDDSRLKNILSDIREYVDVASGIISVDDFIRSCNLQRNMRLSKTVSQGFSRLVKEGIIERHGGKNGLFRKRECEVEDIDFINCNYKTFDVSLPLGLNELVEIYPGNVVMLAGVSNMGKTAFMIDIIYRNMKNFDVHYFNSEMDGKELRKRIDDFQAVDSIHNWTFKAHGMVDNMEDVIVPGNNVINIIDYLELDQEHYKISGMIKRIHERLKGSIAVIAIQKKPGVQVGVGGYGTIYRSRLAINIEKGVCEIFKAKNWKGKRNPNGLKRNFEIVDGWNLSGRGEWMRF
jgi:hypothetical protein